MAFYSEVKEGLCQRCSVGEQERKVACKSCGWNSCADCGDTDGNLFSALASIVTYNGHKEWLMALSKELDELPEDEFYSHNIPVDEWRQEKHVIMMLLIGMYGDWGTSINSGWIQDTKECAAFIRKLCNPDD